MTRAIVNAGCCTPRRFKVEHCDASLNWLALGILLAAWNLSNNDAPVEPVSSASEHQGSVGGQGAHDAAVRQSPESQHRGNFRKISLG